MKALLAFKGASQMNKLTCCVAVAVAGVGGQSLAGIIIVPGDQPTILAAINVANNGDEIVVGPGTYNEQVNFLGKAITLRSSDGPAVTTITFTGETPVRCMSGEGPSTVLEGFTITGACCNDGGMRNDASSPTVVNCVFDSNNSIGMRNLDSSSPMVINCVFNMNSKRGMDNSGGSPTIINCIFFGNGGGGMQNGGTGASPLVIGCQFIDNTTIGQEGGAGMHNINTSPMVVNCLFAGNTSSATGGGMFNEGAAASPAIINCTFVGNSGFGGAMFSTGFATPTVINSILWDNSLTQIFDDLAITTLLYSDIEGGWLGLGSNNIDADSLFVDPANGDYLLQSGSPSIDAGNNWGTVDIADTDLNGNPRFADDPATVDTGCSVPAVVDMGAFEFQGTPATVKLGDIDGDGAVAVPDLLTLLAAWGPTSGCADFDLDGIVGVPDLLILLANWG